MATREQLDAFTGITGADAAAATFYLTAANGDIELAVSTFYESGGAEPEPEGELDEDDDSMTGDVAPPAPILARAVGGGNTLSGAPPSAPPPTWASATSSSASSRSATPANPMRSNQAPRVSTLRDLNSSAPAQQRPDSDDDDDDENKEQLEFFTGGEKSGLSVENPNARRGNSSGGMGDMIKGILQKAKDGGARLGGGEEPSAAGPSQLRSLFGGSAHTLGSDDTPSVLVPDPTAPPPRSAVPGAFPGPPEVEEKEETAVRNLTFWENGFSIEDGDLMDYEDPRNKEILAAINSGRAPLSLLKVRHDQPVELRIAKRLSEKWSRQPSAPVGPFAGSGNRLGSEAAPGFNEVTPVVETPAPASTRQPMATAFEIDSTAPITTLQLRLRSGERLIARFNHSHTIGDIRRYINAAQPGQGASFYALQTTFPSKDLEDDAQTIVDAGILGSVVVQRSL